MFQRWLEIDPAKSCLIIGPKRAGKTTFLKQRFPDYKYVTLDDLDSLDWAQKDPKGFILELGEKAIIDEIQRVPKLTIAVKYAIDNQGALFIMTGSSSIDLLDSASDTLAGRINIYSLPTACWGENLGSYQHSILNDELTSPKIKQGYRLLARAISYGQFPEVLIQSTDEEKHALLINYKNTYFIRDLMQLANIDNLEGLLSIFHNLARSIGSHLDFSHFTRESGLSFPTTKKYLNTLLQSQLVFKLYGYQYGPAKRYLKAAKTYYADNGIIHSLNLNLSDGQLLENFVIAELEKRRKLGFIDCDQFYYYKSVAGREIDLVFEAKGIVYAIEIKSTTKPGKHDIKNLIEFSKSITGQVQSFLFYIGESYQIIDQVKLIPVSALFSGY